MRKKSTQVTEFIKNLHNFIIHSPQLRKKIENKGEAQIQAEIRPVVIQFLEKYFKEAGYKDAVLQANKSFYWEGQEGRYGKGKETVFGTRNYPDFIITYPYLIAIEYKKSKSGAAVKQGLGQSIMHTLCEEFHYVYYLFHDENKDKRIEKSIKDDRESFIINKMWDDFNVLIKLV
ncbi:hypothetical protein KA005_38945 [bacterium]|nr:hypothetical protein [bacterium]